MCTSVYAAWHHNICLISAWPVAVLYKDVNIYALWPSWPARCALVSADKLWRMFIRLFCCCCPGSLKDTALSMSYFSESYLLRLSSSRSEQNIGRRVVSIWHGRWQYLSRHSHQHPVCPDLPSVCLAMSSLVFRPSSCHLLVFILWPD